MPDKTQTVPMQLPFAPMEWWWVAQGNNGTVSHFGLNAFAYDFVPVNTPLEGTQIYAPAHGKVTFILESSHSGPDTPENRPNGIKVEHAPGEVGVPIHLKQGSVTLFGIKVGDIIQMGQKIAEVGDTGTTLGGFHLHFALSNEPIPTPDGYKTIESQFMDYDVSHDNGKTFTIVKSGTPKLGEWIRRRSKWSCWEPLGGKIFDSPGAIAPTSSEEDIYVQGTNNKLFQKFWDGSKWNGWFPILPESPFLMASAPAACSTAPGRRDIFARGKDGGLYHAIWQAATGWSGWFTLGGGIISDPSVVVPSPGVIEVYAQGLDNHLWKIVWDTTKWTNWSQVIPGDTFVMGSAPAVCAPNPNRRDAFVRGKDAGLYHAIWDGTTNKWSGWFTLGGGITTKPAVVSRPSNKLDIFAIDSKGILNQLSWTGTSWSEWINHRDGFFMFLGVAALSRSAEHLSLYASGADGSVWHKYCQ